MKAVLSSTNDDLYLFNLPFAIHSWHKIGVDCIVFIPRNLLTSPKLNLVMDTLRNTGLVHWLTYRSEPEKEATYAQCARLYAAALQFLDPKEILITSDADMCVFDKEYWQQYNDTTASYIIGRDLVPEGQYPMCYLSMAGEDWAEFMEIRLRSYQECLDDLLGKIKADNFRGNYWAKDQETAFKQFNQPAWINATARISYVDRAKPGTQFATRRADRDGWPDSMDLNIIDAHLPRPGYTQENFEKIKDLFDAMYPGDDHDWMFRYCSEYLKLMDV